jgi:hypothetical protein
MVYHKAREEKKHTEHSKLFNTLLSTYALQTPPAPAYPSEIFILMHGPEDRAQTQTPATKSDSRMLVLQIHVRRVPIPTSHPSSLASLQPPLILVLVDPCFRTILEYSGG